MDYKDKYKHTLFLETIRTGRTPKRSGLGYRLSLLGGHKYPVLCTNKTNLPLKHRGDLGMLYELETINRLEYYKNSWIPRSHNQHNLTPYMFSENMRKVFNKYLGDHKVISSSGYVFVYYKPSTVIDWGQLDEDLKNMYPNNHRIDKRGFVYFKE